MHCDSASLNTKSVIGDIVYSVMDQSIKMTDTLNMFHCLGISPPDEFLVFFLYSLFTSGMLKMQTSNLVRS